MMELQELVKHIQTWDVETFKRVYKKLFNVLITLDALFEKKFPKEFEEFRKKEGYDE